MVVCLSGTVRDTAINSYSVWPWSVSATAFTTRQRRLFSMQGLARRGSVLAQQLVAGRDWLLPPCLHRSPPQVEEMLRGPVWPSNKYRLLGLRSQSLRASLLRAEQKRQLLILVVETLYISPARMRSSRLASALIQRETVSYTYLCQLLVAALRAAVCQCRALWRCRG